MTMNQTQYFLVCGVPMPVQRSPYPATCGRHPANLPIHPHWRSPGPIERRALDDLAYEDAREVAA